MQQSNAGGHQNSDHIGPGGSLLLKDALELPDATSTECSTESSVNGNFHVEDNNDYSSSKQLLVDECVHKDSERSWNLDRCTNNQLEDVTEKTIQACLDAQKGVDGDEEHTADMVIIPGANTGLVTDPTAKYSSGKTPEGLSSTSEHKGYDDGFGLSDDHALSLLPLKTNEAAQDSSRREKKSKRIVYVDPTENNKKLRSM